MGTTDLERVTAFEDRYARAQASQVVELPFGYGLLQDQFPLSHYHNRIAVTSPARADELIAAAEQVLGDAGCEHRYVSVASGFSDDLAFEFAAAGFEHETIATMIYRGPAPGPEAGHRSVQSVSLDTIRPAILRHWQVDLPDAGDEQLQQLVERTVLYERGVQLVRLASYDGDEVAGHGDLSLDTSDHIAQFENLVTHDDYRGRGHGGALLQDALRRAYEAGADLFFLTASAADWTYQWYQRVGFVEVSRDHHFSRVC